MPTLIRLEADAFLAAADPFVAALPDQPIPAARAVILPFDLFQAEGSRLLDEGRKVGVRLEPDQAVEGLAYDLPRLSLVAPAFPKFRDGRAYTAAMLLRQRYGFLGEVRAVGDVLREQAFDMVRCGFDAFEPADGSSPEDWARAAGAFRHVYQRAADGRPPAFAERSPFPLEGGRVGDGGEARRRLKVASGGDAPLAPAWKAQREPSHSRPLPLPGGEEQ